MYDNNSAKAGQGGEIKVCYYKVLVLYVKWCTEGQIN